MAQKTTTKTNRYYGEIELSVKAESQLNNELFQDMFEEDGLRAKLTLETADGEVYQTDVLDIIKTKWINYNKL